MSQLRQILRRFRRTPGFTIMAVATLAVGIGANTAIFSVVNGVLIKPLPYPEAERLVGVWHVAPGVPDLPDQLNVSPTMYFTYAEENRTFEHVGLWSVGGASVTGQEAPERLQALFVTHGTLNALGVEPALGRWFSKEDDTSGSEDTVMLTHGFWQRRYGADRAIIGQTIDIDSRPRVVIGVMPERFRFLDTDIEVLMPHRFDRTELFLGNFSYQAIARLGPDVSIEDANADLARMLPVWIESWPAPPGLDKGLFEAARFGPSIQPLKDEVIGDIAQLLWVLMGTIGLVLVIACANVANLLLVRAEARHQEFALRAALGAGQGRLIRELLTESVALSLVSGIVGVGLAHIGLRIFIATGPATLPRLEDIGIAPEVLVFALAASLASGIAFGMIPALKQGGAKISLALRGGGRTMSQSRERHRARNALVVVQVALALVLLVGSGLMIRTFQSLSNVAPGFSAPETVQLMRVSFTNADADQAEQVMRLQQQMIDRLAAIPGVEDAAFSSSVPMAGFNSNDVLYAEGVEYSQNEVPPIRRFRFVTPGFFAATGTALVAGRDYTWTDLYQMRDVAIVSEDLAREHWGDADAAIGQRVRSGAVGPWREVVGVVENVHDDGVHEDAPRIVYWPAMTSMFWGDDVRVTRGGVFLVRTGRAGTEAFLGEARNAIWSVRPNMPVFLVSTLGDVYRESLSRTTFTLTMLAIAGTMALLLGVVGIYGSIAHAVTERTREIGIRMALGAEQRAVQRMFVAQGILVGGIGVALGAVAAFGLTRLMASLLFGVSALDPAAYVSVAGFLIVAATMASYIPARRASRVDPIQALRAE